MAQVLSDVLVSLWARKKEKKALGFSAVQGDLYQNLKYLDLMMS